MIFGQCRIVWGRIVISNLISVYLGKWYGKEPFTCKEGKTIGVGT